MKNRLVYVFAISLTLCLYFGQVTLIVLNSGASVSASLVSNSKLIEQGLDDYKNGDFLGAISKWKGVVNNLSDGDTVTVWKYLVRAYQQVGQVENAITTLNQLVAYYKKVGARQEMGRMFTELAQAYNSLGQRRKAITLLCGDSEQCTSYSAVAIARESSDSIGEISAIISLGNTYRNIGDYNQSIKYLEQALTNAKKHDYNSYIISTLNGLGNTYVSLAKRSRMYLEFAVQAGDKTEEEKFTSSSRDFDNKAISYFEAGLNLSRGQNSINELRLMINLAVPYYYSRTVSNTKSILQQAYNLLNLNLNLNLNSIPDSRDKVYAMIRLANLYKLVTVPIKAKNTESTYSCSNQIPSETVELLQNAVTLSQRIKDKQSLAFAQGQLGHVYECKKDYSKALKLTQQAQLLAGIEPTHYLWDWQAGRILQSQGKNTEAIAAYETSVKALNSIRGDLAIAGRDVQFDFRDTVEPVYRELTQLYLEQDIKQNSQVKNLEFALETIDGLRVAELQNYLGSDCTLPTISKPVTRINLHTAIINTVILENRVAVILTLPGNHNNSTSQLYWAPVTRSNASSVINDLRYNLENRSDLTNAYQQKASQVYDWLIRPFSQQLQQSKIETLVFIHDGIFRTIPMATLYDGNEFLVQKYAIANTLSLTLTTQTQLSTQNLQVLAFGLTQRSAIEGSIYFEPLNYVKFELDNIKSVLPGSKGLIDNAFTPERLKQELTQNTFPIIHLATHGKFGIDSRDTFLVTGKLESDAETTKIKQYNEKLTMSELYDLIRASKSNSLELLTLTACETAVGSDRDALGIAGLSLQAGAHSIVASLWQVDDESTARLIGSFYEHLRQGMSRAKALQKAQKQWLQQNSNERKHPGYWAPLILVGNWL
ncbi:TPR repeat [Calothrix sp. PCC 7716]|nr:TPR repeat [Calothrix sp. PCC 7716]